MMMIIFMIIVMYMMILMIMMIMIMLIHTCANIHNTMMPIGNGLLIDHGTGVVIGETATVGDNVSMLHKVTLGGTGNKDVVRHPQVGDCVLLGAGMKGRNIIMIVM